MRLARAEFLKLRKRKGVWIPAAVLTVGAMFLTYLIIELFHLSNSARYGPAGGEENLRHTAILMSQLSGMIAAILVGAAAATEDLTARVFRELVTTGRSRTQLFLAKVPGGLALLLSLVLGAFVFSAVASTLLAGDRAKAGLGLILKEGLWVVLCATVFYCLALGFGSLVSSRAATIGVLLALLLPVQGILRNIHAFGVGREGLISVALERVGPRALLDRGGDTIPSSLGAAIGVTLLWVLIPLAAGLWQTRRRDA
jgi:ABC-type transport system involved in multi-copper enzyme maturation permease subunit